MVVYVGVRLGKGEKQALPNDNIAKEFAHFNHFIAGTRNNGGYDLRWRRIVRVSEFTVLDRFTNTKGGNASNLFTNSSNIFREPDVIDLSGGWVVFHCVR